MSFSCTGDRHAVVTGHPLATAVAFSLLERGASLGDAAVAASIMLSVVSTHANSIGGDGFALVRHKGRVLALNASGIAPALAEPGCFLAGLPATGSAAAVVPGLPALWSRLHQLLGRSAWSTLFEPAIDAAHRHATSGVLLRNLAVEHHRVAGEPGFAALYGSSPGGEDLRNQFEQPALARTLDALARSGTDAFYRGPIGQSLCASVERAGGLLRPSDLERFEAHWCEPIRARYGPLDVFGFGENAYGVLGLLQLAVLERIGHPRPDWAPADRLDLLMRVAFASLAAVKPVVADPALAGESARRLLADDSVQRVSQAVLQGKVRPLHHLPGGTTGMVMADRQGDAIVILQSNFQPFGCGHVDEETGILLNNRMLCFSSDPGDLNVVGPHKRPAHTHHPVIVERNGALEVAFASPGGISQTITGTQLLVNRFDLGLSPEAAIAAPRWSTNRDGAKVLEEGFGEEIAHALTAHGHSVGRATGSNFFGSIKAVWRQPDGELLATADSRREAAAAAG